MLLTMTDITAGYGHAPVLSRLDIEVDNGEIVCIIGPNGAGKSTVLRTLAGQLPASRGNVVFKDRDITNDSIAQRGKQGLVFIPQGLNVFPNLTVRENLDISAGLIRNRSRAARAVARALETFDLLDRKQHAFARELSGGERQLLAISRAVILEPDLVLLDEPSLGLAPIVVDMIFEKIKDISKNGASVLLVEQNARKGLSVSHRGYVLELGQNRLTGTGQELLESPEVKRLYLGG